jgi:hypothetical protein
MMMVRPIQMGRCCVCFNPVRTENVGTSPFYDDPKGQKHRPIPKSVDSQMTLKETEFDTDAENVDDDGDMVTTTAATNATQSPTATTTTGSNETAMRAIDSVKCTESDVHHNKQDEEEADSESGTEWVDDDELSDLSSPGPCPDAPVYMRCLH